MSTAQAVQAEKEKVVGQALKGALTPQTDGGICALSTVLGVAPETLKIVKDLAATTSSTTFGNVLTGIGFPKLALSMTVDRSWYASMPHVGKALQETIRNEWKSFPAAIIQPLIPIAERLRSGKLMQKTYLKMYVGDSSLGGLYVAIGPDKLWNGERAHLFAWAAMQGSWTKAVDYIIVTHSESDFFGSSSHSTLQRLPGNNKGVTPDDIKHLTSILPMLQKQFQSIIHE